MHKLFFFVSLLCAALPVFAQNWHKIPLPGSGYYSEWGVQPVTRGAILRSKHGDRNIFISTDQGGHWKPLNGPFGLLNEPLTNGIRPLRYGAQDSVIAIDGTDENGQVHCFLTKDLGQNWEEIKQAPEGVSTAPLLVHKGQLFTYGYFPYKYNAADHKWDTLFKKPLRLYAQGATLWLHSQESNQDSIFKSVDGGITWTKPFRLSGNRMLIRGDTFVTTYPFQRSFDGGQNWEPLPPFGPVYELFDDGKYQYVVTDHCTLRSFNFFQTYDTLFNQLITNVFRLDAQHILTSGTDGCYLSNDDGMHWERNNTGIGPSEYGYGVNTAGDYLIGNYTFYGTSGNRSVQAFSSDYGKTWRGCVEHPYLYRLIQVKNNYFGVSGPVLFQSRGDITQWNPVYFPELLAYSDPRLAASNDTLLLFADQSDPFQCRMWWTKTSVEPLVFHAINTALPFSPKGYVMHQGVLYITDDFNVWKSGNFGQSWQLVSSPNIGGALYSDNNRLYFIGFQGIKYLTNAGTNWKDIPFPATMAQQLQAVTVTPNALYIMDGNRQIFYQNAGATVWDSLPGFPPNLGPGRVARFGDYLFIPDNFGNIWTNDPDYVGAFEPKDYAEMHIFPNPANELVSIRCNASENGVIQILDLEGALVQRLALQAGVAAFSTKNMVIGMYIVQHTDAFGRKLESQKLIVQH